MATTGLSSSAETPDAATAASDVDAVVGLAVSPHGSAPEAAVHAVSAALASHDFARRCRVVVAHTGSNEGTTERMREAIGTDGRIIEVTYALQPSDALSLPYHGLAGRARALQAILREAHAQQARACFVTDARSTFAAGWPDRVVQPLLEEAADLVVPAYTRHPFSGALVHGIVYPMFRALYGARLRSPMGAQWGCSRRLTEAVLSDPIWQTDAGQVGIDLWMAATAASRGFRIGQALLGRHQEERAGLDLSTTATQVLGFLFGDMERRVDVWQRVRGSRALPQFGEPQPAPEEPQVDAAALVDSFRLAHRELGEVWGEVLPPLAILQWRRLAAAPLDAFRVDDALWARTIYDFAMGHRLRVIARDHLLGSLTSLYLAWLASFVLEMRQAPPEVAEARLERLCLVFEAEKPYLISQWRWPERFKPVKLRR